MTVQFDESVPARLAKSLAALGCRAQRFPNEWKGLKNGELLSRLQQRGTTCLITCDKNMQHQQSISKSGLALIVLPRQRFGDLAPLASSIVEAVRTAIAGRTISVGSDGGLTGF